MTETETARAGGVPQRQAGPPLRRRIHAAPIVTSVEDLRDVRHITELRGKEAAS